MHYNIELTDAERIELLVAVRADIRWWQEFRPYTAEFRKTCLKNLASAYHKVNTAEPEYECDCDVPYDNRTELSLNESDLRRICLSLQEHAGFMHDAGILNRDDYIALNQANNHLAKLINTAYEIQNE